MMREQPNAEGLAGLDRGLLDQCCEASDVADLVRDSILVIDDAMNIVAVNAAFESAYLKGPEAKGEGCTLGAVLRCRYAATGRACGNAEGCRTCGWFQAVHACRARGEGESECRILTTDLHAYDFVVRVRPLSLPGAAGGAWICSLADVYAKKRLRVLEKSFFHDLVNQAVGIRGITELLEEGEEDVASLHEMLRSSAVRLVADIERLRTLRVAENGDVRVWFSPHRPEDLLRTVLERYQDEIEARRLAVDLTVASDGALLETDPELFLMILGDLVLNAIEASGRGEKITVRCVKEAERFVFSVRNAAVLDQAARDHLFERSFSTKGDGRGVGAYRAKLIAERFMKGQVWFTSCEADGTVFYVSFPMIVSGDQGQ